MKRFALVILLLSCVCNALERQPNADYRVRREKLAAKLNGGIALVFADNENLAGDAIWGFHQGENFYYLSGWAEPAAAVLIVGAADAQPAAANQPARPARAYTEVLFLPARHLTPE